MTVGGSYPASIEELIERGERGEKLTRDDLLLIVGAMDIAVARWWAGVESRIVRVDFPDEGLAKAQQECRDWWMRNRGIDIDTPQWKEEMERKFPWL